MRFKIPPLKKTLLHASCVLLSSCSSAPENSTDNARIVSIIKEAPQYSGPLEHDFLSSQYSLEDNCDEIALSFDGYKIYLNQFSNAVVNVESMSHESIFLRDIIVYKYKSLKQGMSEYITISRGKNERQYIFTHFFGKASINNESLLKSNFTLRRSYELYACKS